MRLAFPIAVAVLIVLAGCSNPELPATNGTLLDPMNRCVDPAIAEAVAAAAS